MSHIQDILLQFIPLDGLTDLPKLKQLALTLPRAPLVGFGQLLGHEPDWQHVHPQLRLHQDPQNTPHPRGILFQLILLDGLIDLWDLQWQHPGLLSCLLRKDQYYLPVKWNTVPAGQDQVRNAL